MKGSVKKNEYDPLRKSLVKPAMWQKTSQLYRVVRFFCPRLLCRKHLILFSEHLPIYASRMTISGEEPNNTL